MIINNEEPLFLDEKEVLSYLEPGGILSFSIPGYEAREAQLAMTRDVVESFNKSSVALIEAGTGTGKSLAYLLPSIFFALKFGERICISTHTINLQEQLLQKDIPFLSKVLGFPLKAALVKGMSNYLCLKRFHEYEAEHPLLSEEQSLEMSRLFEWKGKTEEGSKSDICFPITPEVWSEVSAESDTCQRADCPFFRDCFFFKARKKAEEANLLIVNHHLLTLDLISRKQNASGGILPAFSRVILDEAHHLEDVALEHFAEKVSKFDLQKLMARLYSESKTEVRLGKLNQLKRKIDEHFVYHDEVVEAILCKIEIDLPGGKQLITNFLQEAFQTLTFFFGQISERKEGEDPERKYRLRKEHLEHPLWKSEVVSKVKLLSEALKQFCLTLNSLELDIQFLDNEKLNEKTKLLRQDIQSFSKRLEQYNGVIQKFIDSEMSSKQVRWLEMRSMKGYLNVYLIHAELDISRLLAETLFTPLDSVVLASATLTSRNRFDYIKSRLGLHLIQKSVKEKIYPSPFDYEKQVLLLIPNDMPGPSDIKFHDAACMQIAKAIEISRGGAFVLFTSFSMLKAFQKRLESFIRSKRYPFFVQGSDQRKILLENFKKSKHSVLFGTDSFWEGVDVVGDGLRCVIIVKLPFKVPSEPLIEARCEAIDEEGGDSFLDYTIPNAIVKFKQGFGRLVRNKEDRGCILCLDKRLLNKGYGKFFINSLPKSGQVFEESAVVHDKMQAFYMN